MRLLLFACWEASRQRGASLSGFSVCVSSRGSATERGRASAFEGAREKSCARRGGARLEIAHTRSHSSTLVTCTSAPRRALSSPLTNTNSIRARPLCCQSSSPARARAASELSRDFRSEASYAMIGRVLERLPPSGARIHTRACLLVWSFSLCGGQPGAAVSMDFEQFRQLWQCVARVCLVAVNSKHRRWAAAMTLREAFALSSLVLREVSPSCASASRSLAG